MNFIPQEIDRIYPELVAIRRHIHQYPEVSFKEFETTKFIIKQLEPLGLKIHRPLDTGCVAVLEGGISSDRVVALRADIDALPMDEEGAFKQAFASKHPGVAHCCGHDMHTANLIGVAKLLAAHREKVAGKVVFIFQPAEEKLPGGGKLIVNSGILDTLGVQEVYGLHTDPRLPVGEAATRVGPLMARPDEIILTIHGKGGHAASPHKAVDPIVIAAQVVTSVQSIISRYIDPNEPAVITFGKISGGSAHNIIPEKVQLLGTVRTFSASTAEFIADKIERLAKGIAQAFGGDAQLEFSPGYPAVINNAVTTEKFKQAHAQQFEDSTFHWLEAPTMAGEDFAFYQEKYPGTFFFLGSSSEETESVYSWHHPRYNADERCMKMGVALLSQLVLNG